MGLDAATSPTNGWNNELRDGSLAVTDVVRTSDTVVTVTLPADAQYNVTSAETITATVPASALEISAAAVVASPTFVISTDVAATVAVTGTLTSSADSDDVINGGRTIILTVSDDTWVAGPAQHSMPSDKTSLMDWTHPARRLADGIRKFVTSLEFPL